MTQDTQPNSLPSDSIPEEIANKATPFGFVVNLAQALEARIDYNFNSMIQLSILVEYLYEKLDQSGIKIDLTDEDFTAFQDSRITEIQEQLKEAATPPQPSEEDLKEILKNNIKESPVDLTDD